MRRVAQVVVVLAAFGLLGGALYLNQQDSLVECELGPTKVYGPSSAVQHPESLALNDSRPFTLCDQRRAAAQSHDHLELAAIAAAALLLAGWLVLRRPRSAT